MPRILITGKNGQVGFELQRSLAVLGEVIAIGREDCDLADPAAIDALVERIAPDVIVNPAAYTAVDRAETDAATARAINETAPATFAAAAVRRGALLVHYSTDYVFDGTQTTPYRETDTAAPRSVYGQTKRDGELAIERSGCRYVTLRTSWVYGAWGNNFAKTILRLAKERDALKVVADQFGAPTPAALIADVTAHIVARYLGSTDAAGFPFGTYHLTTAGETSWHGYATTLINTARALGAPMRLDPAAITPVSTPEYPLPAPRPASSRLSTEKLQRTFGLILPPWEQALAHVLRQLIPTEKP
ncbi:dTDP-4-dehydrorhamnose reductase [Silvimonas iriomotensis]|uniref:dTDP-4-dehydrorhamnose reductase n=1 Tax=Silvimonas iriomotensis TaxID=449662 RepID=A0ABQ2PE79_9NEIS|nr:dTDP-4-dehydrorhamnose reductase [Silvimonas iriomotensis]GGP23648.1 NAD(P)-dependent oxidoreductase [Silvimonas iriomotensis]